MELVTDRLLLREFVLEDLDALAAYQSDSRYRQFYGPEEHSSERSRQLLDELLSRAA